MGEKRTQVRKDYSWIFIIVLGMGLLSMTVVVGIKLQHSKKRRKKMSDIFQHDSTFKATLLRRFEMQKPKPILSVSSRGELHAFDAPSPTLSTSPLLQTAHPSPRAMYAPNRNESVRSFTTVSSTNTRFADNNENGECPFRPRPF
jgi:hypothetical protein